MARRLVGLALAWALIGAGGCGSDFEAQDPIDEPRCGNELIEEGEICDGANLAGNDCSSVGEDFTSGELRCNASCDGWDTGSCVQGEGRLEGEVATAANLSCTPDDAAADCQGALWVLVLEEDPVTNLLQTPVASTMLPGADLGAGQRVSYAVPQIPEGSFYVTAFMDDDDNASAVAPGPDAGDPIAFPATVVTIEHDTTVEQDLTLTIAMP